MKHTFALIQFHEIGIAFIPEEAKKFLFQSHLRDS